MEIQQSFAGRNEIDRGKMLLQEPGQSPYDLRFQILGFPVRVSWTFWAASAVFGYSISQYLDFALDPDSPGFIVLLLLWTVCLFVSILIHELGHALAFRRNGMESSIVLYFLGGLAIPEARSSQGRGAHSSTPQQAMWIAAAGPLAQIASAAVVVLAIRLLGYRGLSPWPPLIPWPLDHIAWLRAGNEISSVGLVALSTMYVYPSVLWAILNLIPVWPLDGGRIMSSLMQMWGGNIVQTLWVSVVTAALVAAYGFANGERYLGFLFLILAVNNYQAIQQVSGPRY